MARHRYHHGDLRRTLLDAAVEAIEESGAAALSLRDLARRAGVSHAAPAHHFGDKAGLLTALAVEGYAALSEALRASGGDILEMGVAYVRFAEQRPAHFEVMFQPTLYRAEDPEVERARSGARAALYGGVTHVVRRGTDARRAGLAAWSMVHGFATLWRGGALPADLGDDPGAAARAVIRLLFRAR